MSSLLWYCSLAVMGAGPAAFIIYKKRHTTEVSTFVVFYLFATSITWFGEFTALGIFNGYAYKPGVYTDPWAENLVGHLMLNSFLWPGTATLVVGLSLGYGWISLITVGYILAEYLFVKLGTYEQHWWRYYMSAIIVVLFHVIAKKWHERMNRVRHGLTRNTTFFFVFFVIFHLPIPLLLLFGKQYYNVGWVQNAYRSSTIFALVYNLIECCILVIFICFLKKWYWKLLLFIMIFLSDSILATMNILIFENGWNLFYATLINAICISIFILFEKYTLKPLID